MKTHKNGRISFACVEYEIQHDDWTETMPYPPTYESHPAPSTPVPLDSHGKAKKIAMGEVKPIPNSLPYREVVLDLEEYERLKRTRLLYDPRHTGHKTPEVIDNRSTS